VPAHKSAFRVTHRFTRPISCDTCPNSFAADGFGTDGGAVIGLEYRVGIVPNGEIGVYRTADKTVELFGQYGVVRQGARAPLEASVLAAVDVSDVGRHNTDSEYSPTLGVILARLVGDHAALYVEPMWVHHTNLFEQATVSDDDTVLVGLGARVRIRPTVYLVGEYSPRVSGYKPGTDAAAFGPHVPAEFLELLRHHVPRDRARGIEGSEVERIDEDQLVHGLQHHAEVLLTPKV
jgi:hypothetical protein